MKFKIDTLDKGYHDPDQILLHACFQCLVNFVEKEKGLTHCSYESYNEKIDTCKELYDWWKENYDKLNFNETKEQDEKLKRLIDIHHFLWT